MFLKIFVIDVIVVVFFSLTIPRRSIRVLAFQSRTCSSITDHKFNILLYTTSKMNSILIFVNILSKSLPHFHLRKLGATPQANELLPIVSLVDKNAEIRFLSPLVPCCPRPYPTIWLQKNPPQFDPGDDTFLQSDFHRTMKNKMVQPCYGQWFDIVFLSKRFRVTFACIIMNMNSWVGERTRRSM